MLKWVTRDLKGVIRGSSLLQGITGCYMGLQMFTGGCRGLQEVTGA